MVRKSSPWESLRDASDTFPFIKAKEREFGTYIRGEHSGVKKKIQTSILDFGEKNPDLFLPIQYLAENTLVENVCWKTEEQRPIPVG